MTFAGYFFYLTRRMSRGLVIPAILHGMFDFSMISTTVVYGKTYAGALAAIAAYLILGVVLLVRRHRIEPAAHTRSSPRIQPRWTAKDREDSGAGRTPATSRADELRRAAASPWSPFQQSVTDCCSPSAAVTPAAASQTRSTSERFPPGRGRSPHRRR